MTMPETHHGAADQLLNDIKTQVLGNGRAVDPAMAVVLAQTNAMLAVVESIEALRHTIERSTQEVTRELSRMTTS